jgi:flagellar FliL protein
LDEGYSTKREQKREIRMSDETPTSEEEPKKKGGKLGLVLGIVLALAGGGGAFYAVNSGMILGSSDDHAEEEHVEQPDEKVAFVPIDRIIVSMGSQARYQLRFNAQLEVVPDKAEQVTLLMPRILDVLNGYLRAVDVEELEDPSALLNIRIQKLRRVQLVTGKGHVNDLLITEFVFG